MRHPQSACPCNVRFARDLPNGSPFAAREALAGRDARTLTRAILAMDTEGYHATFNSSPMKRAKLPMLRRNAVVMLGNVGTADDVDVLLYAIHDPEPLVREHAEWAMERVRQANLHRSSAPADAPRQCRVGR